MEPSEGKMTGTSGPEDISTRRRRIAELAKGVPGVALTTLAHHIDIDWMKEAYRLTRKDGAAGVDGRTSADFEQGLEGNLRDLLERAKSGTYRAPSVKRVHIPKGTGAETRPIGIPTFEDKVLQRAVAMVLESVYEQEFHDGSWGFRPGRSAHGALDSLWKQAMGMRGGWVVEVDIRKFFDTLDHRHLRDILQKRVRDGVLIRLIGKWLHAGVLEEGVTTYPDAGTPQGGVISPLLANIYLHEVLDRWYEEEVRPRLKGRSFLVRYADDFVMVFSQEVDARRVLDVLPKRFARYGLTLHPTKTQLVAFSAPGRGRGGDEDRGGGGPGTFDLLGFTHYWGKSRRGNWVIFRKTAKDRLHRALKAVAQWCRTAFHQPLVEQHRTLVRKLRGHMQYYGLTGNGRALCAYRHWVYIIWRKWLSRRSRHTPGGLRGLDRRLGRFPLPAAVVVHSVYRPVANP